MARIGIYVPDPQCPPATHLIKGLRAGGHVAVPRLGQVFTHQQVERDFAAVISYGARGGYGTVLTTYAKHLIPAFVLDSGYVLRAKGYHAFGVGRINGLQPFPASPDRAQALGLLPFVTPQKKRGEKIVILGQVPGDAQHGMSPMALLGKYGQMLDAIREASPRQIAFRPHPKDESDDPASLGVAILPSSEPLIDQLADAFAVVTYNSTAALEAIRLGIPVFCNSSAVYAEIAQNDLALIEVAKPPEKAAVERFAAKLAYGIWTLEEIEGEAWAAHFNALLARDDVENAEAREERIAAEFATLEARINSNMVTKKAQAGKRRVMGTLRRRGVR